MNVGYKICFFVLIFQNTGELIRKLERKYKGKNESDKSPVILFRHLFHCLPGKFSDGLIERRSL